MSQSFALGFCAAWSLTEVKRSINDGSAAEAEEQNMETFRMPATQYTYVGDIAHSPDGILDAQRPWLGRVSKPIQFLLTSV